MGESPPLTKHKQEEEEYDEDGYQEEEDSEEEEEDNDMKRYVMLFFIVFAGPVLWTEKRLKPDWTTTIKDRFLSNQF
jgi:hypothetical protein